MIQKIREQHKTFPRKGGCKQLALDTQSEFNGNVLNTTPKYGVSYLKWIGNNGIMQNHAQWEKGCTSDFNSAHGTADDIREINSKQDIVADIVTLHLVCCKKKDSYELIKTKINVIYVRGAQDLT